MAGVTIQIRHTKHQDIKPPHGEAQVKVGFPAGKVGSDIVDRAVYNQFGTSRGIPARPFLSNAMRKNKDKYGRFIKDRAKRILSGEISPDQALMQLGVMAESDVKTEITELKTPPNAPSTIRQKGSSNPLIDTGAMRASVTYVVEKG